MSALMMTIHFSQFRNAVEAAYKAGFEDGWKKERNEPSDLRDPDASELYGQSETKRMLDHLATIYVKD